jgi:hypothetical protein
MRLQLQVFKVLLQRTAHLLIIRNREDLLLVIVVKPEDGKASSRVEFHHQHGHVIELL